MEILEWPSIRVTGSMVMVWRGIWLSEFGRGVGNAALQQFAQCRKDEVRGRRAAGDEDVDGHHFMHRAGGGQKAGNRLARDLGVERGVFQVGAAEDGIGAELVAHGGN